MIVAITSRGSTPDSDIDERFGRTYWLMLYDTTSNNWQAIDNSAARSAMQGAGQKTAQILIDNNVEALLSGETGPRAFRILKNAGIAIYHGAAGTVMDSLVAWHDGRLTEAACANNIGSPNCITGTSQSAH